MIISNVSIGLSNWNVEFNLHCLKFNFISH